MVLTSGVIAQMDDRDSKVVKALIENGSDITKDHLIDFLFYFDTLESAGIVANTLKANEFEVKVFENEDGSFSVEAKKSMVPSVETMQDLTQRLEGLASKYNGEFDGWGTEVVE